MQGINGGMQVILLAFNNASLHFHGDGALLIIIHLVHFELNRGKKVVESVEPKAEEETACIGDSTRGIVL